MLLLRHVSAGARLPSRPEDRGRRLDVQGRRDARRLPRILAGQPIERIVTSPYARCVESVELLAAKLGIALELRDELAPEAELESTLALLGSLPDTALLCTHREVVERLFSGEVTCEKGGTWILERHDGSLRPSAYLPAPAPGRPRRRAALV
jgi:8-oxo-dGTP diphosphatase